MESNQNVLRLIDKIQSAEAKIKLRSIDNLATKISINIIKPETLHQYKKLPGILLNWINQNTQKSEHLFKVLTILNYIAQTQEGIVLLEKYEATQFFRELRIHLMKQGKNKHDQYTDLLERMIKALLPLYTSSHPEGEEVSMASNTPLQQSKVKEKDHKKEEKLSASNILDQNRQIEGVTLKWTVAKDVLGKKQEDELYGLFMELRHSNKEIQLQLLKRMHDLLKYWGQKWFKFKADLVTELTQQHFKSKFKWLITQILRTILKTANQNSKQLMNKQFEGINLNLRNPVVMPQTDQVAIHIRSQLFDSVYSIALLDDIVQYQFQDKNQREVDLWLVSLPFKYCPDYFIQGLRKCTNNGLQQLSLTTLNKQIQFYNQHYPNSLGQISQSIQSLPEQWNLKPHDFPILLNHLHHLEQSKAYTHIAKYDSEWQLGSNLHIIGEVMGNLEKGVEGVTHPDKIHHLVQLYIHCMLTLGAAVEKQDPLMRYYPKMRDLVIQIAQNQDANVVFYQQLLSTVNSHANIKFGSKAVICSELALAVLSEPQLFRNLFSLSFRNEESLSLFLETAKRRVLTMGIEQIDEYSCLFYSLTYHKNEQIREISKFLLSKLSKSGKIKVILAKMFSVSQEERTNNVQKIFESNVQNILKSIQSKEEKKEQKKPLKIGVETIQNFIKIIFNQNLEEHTQINAGQQLLEYVERMQLNQGLISILLEIENNITLMISKGIQVSSQFLEILVQVRTVINCRTNRERPFDVHTLIQLLEVLEKESVLKMLLKEIYLQCFKNPFSQNVELHFVSELYPHLPPLQLPCSKKPSSKVKNSKGFESKSREAPLFSNFRQTKELEHVAEWVIHQTLNKQKVVLDQCFVEIVQKQIGQIIHAQKGYLQLHFLNYLLHFIKQHKIALPEAITDHSASLLNNLLSKQISSIHSQATAQIICLIGNRRTRQMTNLLANANNGSWKLFLIQNMSNIDPNVIQSSLKGLLGYHYGREAALTLKTLLPHIKKTQLSQFSKSLILSSCVKYFRQEGDPILRKIAVSVLIQIYGSCNLPFDSQSQIFSSITAVITEQQLPSDLLTLALTLAKMAVQQDKNITSQETVLKLLLNRLFSLTSCQSSYYPLQAAVLELFRSVLQMERSDLLSGIDLIDVALSFLGIVQKNEILEERHLLLLTAAIDILYISAQSETDLPKFILSSTRTQSQLLQALSVSFKAANKNIFLESVSRLWLTLSINQQDLFVYKMSHLLSNNHVSLMEVLAKHVREAGNQYLKMIGWTMIVWSKNRQELDDEHFGDDFSSALLNCSQPELIKMLLPFSLKAKKMFLSSALLSDSLREATAVVESRIVRDTKDKKKKNKVHTLSEKQTLSFVKIFDLLSALFYWNGQERMEGGQNMRKIMSFIQKFYIAGNWQDSIMKMFLKVTTNLSLSVPLSDSIAARLSQNGTFVEQIANCIIKTEIIDASSKIAIKIATSLVHIESVRAQFLRARVIEELSARIIKIEERNQLNLEYLMQVVELLVSFSGYKDANQRICEKKLTELLVRMLGAGKLSLLQAKIATLLNNLACYKHNKNILMNCRDLHKSILGLLQDPEISYRPTLLSLLYNLLFKNSAAIKLYRKPEVIELIQSVGQAQGQEVEEICGALKEALSRDEA